MDTETVLYQQDSEFGHSKTLYVFWAGFIIYTIGFTLSTSSDPDYLLCNALQVLGIVLLLPAACRLIAPDWESSYLKFLFPLYCIWLLGVVLRGFSLNYGFIKSTLFNPFGGVFLYVAPLILLFPRHPVFYKAIFKVVLILGLFYMLQVVLNLQDLLNLDSLAGKGMTEYYIKTLALPSGFLLLTYSYQSNKRKLIAFFVIVFTILLATFRARRGLMFMSGSVLLFYCYIFIYLNKRQFTQILFSVLLLALIGAFGYSIFTDKSLDAFDFAKERLEEDTRSEVEMYYYADMETEDWLVGRGLSGLVAAPVGIMDDHVEGKPGYRDGIETDYLNIILKGGLVSLGLLLLIAVPAMFKGLFFSQNVLSKAAGLWILLWLLSLYPSTVTTFTLNYLLVWISIGICYSKTIRSMPEDELVALMKS